MTAVSPSVQFEVCPCFRTCAHESEGKGIHALRCVASIHREGSWESSWERFLGVAGRAGHRITESVPLLVSAAASTSRRSFPAAGMQFADCESI